MKHTDTVNQKIKLYVLQPVEKKPEEYERPRCHPNMHKFDYPIKDTILVNPALATPDAVPELRQMLQDRHIEGKVILVRMAGGPGRRGKFESHEHWRGKRKSGWVEIARFEV